MALRTIILTDGTRGDNEPYVALGKALIDSGHTVLLCNSIIRPADDSGVGLMQKPADADAIMKFDNDTTAKASGVPFHDYGMPAELIEVLDEYNKHQREDIGFAAESKKVWRTACENMYKLCRVTRTVRAKQMFRIAKSFQPDLIIQGVIYCDALSIAEKLNAPVIRALLWPAIPTHEFPLLKHETYVDNDTWQDALAAVQNPIETYDDSIRCWETDFDAINKRRKEIFQLPALDEATFRDYYAAVPSLIGYSSYLLPIPKDWKDAHFCGFWKQTADADRDESQVSDDLKRFMENGPAPVYIGFGSAPVEWIGRDSKWITQLVVRALIHAGRRGVIFHGVADIDLRHLTPENTPDYEKLIDYAQKNIIFIDAAPHTWLFPKCSAIVHHGGIGSTTTSVMAQKPTIITPLFFDQPIIAANLQRIAAGVKMPFLSQCTPETLGTAILRAISDDTLIQGARKAGIKVADECRQSASLAVAHIERLYQHHRWPWKTPGQLKRL